MTTTELMRRRSTIVRAFCMACIASGSFTPVSAYVSDATTVTAEQLSKAGVRLAYVLNQALRQQAPLRRHSQYPMRYKAATATAATRQ